MDKEYDERVSLSENPTRFIKQRVSAVSDVSPTLDNDDDSSPFNKRIKLKPALLTSVVAGGIAGVFVDITLYPLDTVKTRLQSKHGFTASGGFKGVYKGVIPVLLCSAPLSALFFATYNTLVNTLRTNNSALNPVVYVISATCAELISSTVRVPLEIVKQRKQTSNTTSSYIIKQTLKKEGIPGFYRGFWSTLWREIPFAAIQYPLWEMMIYQFISYQHGKELTALQIAYCGASAGAIAAALTTPMDVIKTRIMLEEKEKIDKLKEHLNYNIAKEVRMQKGIKGLFAGVVPRVLWITLGGFLYFGAYEKTKLVFEERCRLLSEGLSRVHHVAPSYLEEKMESFVFSKEGRCELSFPRKSRSIDEKNNQSMKEAEETKPSESAGGGQGKQQPEEDNVSDAIWFESSSDQSDPLRFQPSKEV